MFLCVRRRVQKRVLQDDEWAKYNSRKCEFPSGQRVCRFSHPARCVHNLRLSLSPCLSACNADRFVQARVPGRASSLSAPLSLWRLFFKIANAQCTNPPIRVAQKRYLRSIERTFVRRRINIWIYI